MWNGKKFEPAVGTPLSGANSSESATTEYATAATATNRRNRAGTRVSSVGLTSLETLSKDLSQLIDLCAYRLGRGPQRRQLVIG